MIVDPVVPGTARTLSQNVAEILAPVIKSMSAEAIGRIRELEELNAQGPQLECTTYHLMHAGMYSRTIRIPAGGVLTGALIKRATVLVFNGDALVATGDEGGVHLTGYHVIAASANRKQAFVALADTDLTMIFPTQAPDVERCEEEFTDEADRLFSRRGANVVNITGE